MISGLIFGVIYLFWDFFYWAKWAASLLALCLRKKIHRRRFDLYDFEVKNQPEKLGVLVPKEEKILESPFPEEHLQNAADEICMYGVNSKSEALVVRISRTCNDESEAWLYLKLADGRWYELEQAAGFQRTFGGKCTSFTCGGLQMYYLEPMRRWRIVYSGILREKKISNEIENKSVFVKFIFVWTASSDVYDASYDLDVRTTADAMAKAKWNSLYPPVHKVAESLNFYSQSGVMNGTVSIEDEPDKEIYFFGERTRHLGKRSYLAGCKFKHILGVVPEIGLVLHLAKQSIPNTFDNMYFGFVVHPNGLLYTIKDGMIVSNFSGIGAEGKNLTVMIKAGKHLFEMRGNAIGESVRYTGKRGWSGRLELTGMEFEIDGCKGIGFLMTGEMSDAPIAKIQRSPSHTSFKKPLTVYFTDDISHLTELTGGKGSSLGKLTKISNDMKSLNFTVPRGIVVTTEAYEKFLTCEIIEKIENLKNVAYGNVKGNIHAACKVVSSTIEHAYLPDVITKEIEEKLNKLFSGNINRLKVAVRSSATGEDTDQMSAAGQMDTFLGVQGLEDILIAVKKCWASQFGHIAIQYKKQNGQILNSPMAVVIQEMVDCEVAGVLFTCDPVTNNPSVAVITGNYGLGESVVSGSEEPDTVILQKLSKKDVKIKSVIVGLKRHKIIMAERKTSEEKEGTVIEDVSQEEQNKLCISEELAVQLGRLSLNIEDYFKSPRDIEWGIKNNCIYILQSRPVTTDGAISDYEMKHEFDAPLRCEKEFFTKANLGEVMPRATTPLGLDVIIKYLSMVFQGKTLRRMQRNNFHQWKYFATGLVTFYNHFMVTVVDLLTRVDDPDSVDFQGMMIAIFGRKVEDPDLLLLVKSKKYDPLKKDVPYYLTLFKNLFFSALGIEALKDKVFNYQVPAEKGKTSKEIFDLLLRSCSHHFEPFLKHMCGVETSAFWNMLMLGVLAKAKGGIDNEVYSDFSKLLASSSNVESADVPSAMQTLANTIAKEINGKVFRSMSLEEVQKWLETSNGASSCKYREFIKRHGHRCVKEYDLHSLPWNTDPKPLIKLLQGLSGSCEDTAEKKEKEISDILPHLSVPLNLKSRLLLKFFLPNCRRGVRERELFKSNVIKSMDNYRKGFRHLSKAMVAEGYLPDPELVYFFTINEISELLESRNPRLIARAIHRRKIFPALDVLRFPEISKGLPVPINEDETVEYKPDLTMKGIPVSQGTVKGYARVAMSVEEAFHLKPGEILITYGTDVGWSPYFPILAGVVTELGGLISHGAVVSREYGLPCVVGLHGATKQFLTGDYVLLDGNKGILQRLPPPPEN